MSYLKGCPDEEELKKQSERKTIDEILIIKKKRKGKKKLKYVKETLFMPTIQRCRKEKRNRSLPLGETIRIIRSANRGGLFKQTQTTQEAH